VPVLVRSVRGLVASDVVGHAVVLVPEEVVDAVSRLLAGLPVTVVAGYADVAAAVGARSGGRAAVLVHDAARPLTPPALAEVVTRSVDDVHGVAVPVLPLADTVKRVNSDGSVVAGPDRTGLRVVQTPQAFRPELLDGLGLARVLAADPVERAWTALAAAAVTVPGHPLAFPVRSAWDRELAEVLAGEAVTT
jgi:2-C-methyl-D-erythritol 4-phosphate cytidylyltransferase